MEGWNQDNTAVEVSPLDPTGIGDKRDLSSNTQLSGLLTFKKECADVKDIEDLNKIWIEMPMVGNKLWKHLDDNNLM